MTGELTRYCFFVLFLFSWGGGGGGGVGGGGGGFFFFTQIPVTDETIVDPDQLLCGNLGIQTNHFDLGEFSQITTMEG